MTMKTFFTFALALLALLPACAQTAITSFSPTVGLKGTLVQIKGTGLKSVSDVAIHGVPAKFTANSDTLLTALVPAATSGPITLTTPSGTITSVEPFAVGKPLLAIVGLSPFTGSAGTLVQIKGMGFTGATSVKFGGVPCRFLVTSDKVITVTVPKGAKSGLVTVAAPGGFISSPSAFQAM